MKKYFLSVLLNMLILSLVLGQEQPKDNELFFKNIQRNSVFIELGGLGAIVSVNYERCVPTGNKTGFGFRIGAGTAGSADTANTATTYTTMLETNFLYGKSKHFLETGIGFANAFVKDETEQWVTVKLGYRYQAKKGFLFKIAPMYIYNFKILKGNKDVFDGIWLGVALGYSF
jgi:hypothetical protein